MVEAAESTTNRGAARKFSVDEANVSYWRKQKQQLKATTAKKRLPGAGRKAKLPEMEEQLASWVMEQRSRNLRVTRGAIQQKAFELHQGEEEFSASKGWLEKFFKQHEFTLRRRTTVDQKLPQDHITKTTSYLMRVRKMRHSHKYPLSAIGNMDKPPLWLDMPGDTTVAGVGERSVPIRTTGHDKGWFTVILSAMVNGKKLKPFVVFKGVRPIPELTHHPGTVVVMSKNGWMNEDLTVEYVDKVWGCLSFICRLLIWDAYTFVHNVNKKCHSNYTLLNYRCHMTDRVRRHVDKQTKTDICIIPGGTTNHLQPS